VFKALESTDGLLVSPTRDETIFPPSLVVAPILPNVPSKVISQRISFPSSDEETASYAIGWRIPKPDFKTSVALEVLLRYLHDTGI
jgi:Zn-dependent M16 (insulinase) family peptidase